MIASQDTITRKYLYYREQLNRYQLLSDDTITDEQVKRRKYLTTKVAIYEDNLTAPLPDYTRLIVWSRIGAAEVAYNARQPNHHDKRDHMRKVYQTMQFIALADKYLSKNSPVNAK